MFDPLKKRYRFRIIIPAYPAFNIYSHSAKRTTALGPVCIATAVNEMEQWDVEVIDENNLTRFGPRDEDKGADHNLLQELRPADVVGFYGGLTSTIPRLYELARFYKAKGAITVAGGQHFIGENIKEALENGIDYVVIGEGEETIKKLFAAFTGKINYENVKGIAFMKDGNVIETPKRESITDFDKLPLPDFSLVRYAKISVYPIERIRGCGMECEFCTVKGKLRCASPERMLERISYLLETRGARVFFVVDDLFGQDRDETIRFCNMLRDYQKRLKVRMDLGVQIRLDKAKDPELLKAMREASINMVAIGYESPIDAELKAMNKRLKSEDMLKMTKVFRDFGFLVHGMFIFCYPMKEGLNFSMSPDDRAKHYRKFIKKAKIDTIQVLLPVPLPGTQLRDRLLRQHRIYPLQDVGWEYYDGSFPLFMPDKPMNSEEIHAAGKTIMSKFYHFKNMFMVGFTIVFFPALLFHLHDIKAGWRMWYRPWRNRIIRFGGWATMRQWTSAFHKDVFFDKIKKAKQDLSLKKYPV